MTFLSPWFLLLLLPVAAIGVLYVLQRRRRSRYAVRFATLPMLDRLVPDKPGWRRHAPAAALLTALVLLGLAVARPEIPLRAPRDNATIMVAVDTSGSMAVTDVEPDRMTAASSAAASFIDDLPERFRVGLVSFASTTTVQAAPSLDHESTAAAARSLTATGGTAIGDSIFASLDQIDRLAQQTDTRVPAQIVLLSDGTNTDGRSLASAVAAANEARVPVSTIAFGTAEGTLQTLGRSQRAPADIPALAAVADDTGGTAYTAENTDELDDVYEDVQSAIGWTTEPTEITQYLAAIALLLVLAAAAMSLRWFSRLT